MQKHNTHSDISDYLRLPPLASHMNFFFQFFVKWSVAITSAFMGPTFGGVLNANLWRIRVSLLLLLMKTRLESNKLHFIHIPRTGGTSAKKMISDTQGAAVGIVTHFHGVKVGHLGNSGWLMLIRDPIDRLDSCLRQISKNYDRGKKVGAQKRVIRWQIEKFPTLEDISLALASNSTVTRLRGYLALNSGGELTEPLSSWVSMKEIDRNPPVFVAPHDDSSALEDFLSAFFEKKVERREKINSAGQPTEISGRHEELRKFLQPDYVKYHKLLSLSKV